MTELLWNPQWVQIKETKEIKKAEEEPQATTTPPSIYKTKEVKVKFANIAPLAYEEEQKKKPEPVIDEFVQSEFKVEDSNHLVRLHDLNELNHLKGRICGIYAFVHNGEVIYVGQSINVLDRLHQHLYSYTNSEKLHYIHQHWNEVKFLIYPLDVSKLNDYEKFYIEKYKPRFNKAGTKRKYAGVKRKEKDVVNEQDVLYWENYFNGEQPEPKELTVDDMNEILNKYIQIDNEVMSKQSRFCNQFKQ